MENKELTDKLNLPGGGLTKSYEESIIVHSCNTNFGHAYNNQIFLDQIGGLHWEKNYGDKTEEQMKNDYEKKENNPNYKKVTILKVYQDGQGGAYLEVIETSTLREHLLQEAKEKREMMSRLAFIAERLGYMEDPNKLIL